jgi:hypothetical protein
MEASARHSCQAGAKRPVNRGSGPITAIHAGRPVRQAVVSFRRRVLAPSAPPEARLQGTGQKISSAARWVLRRAVPAEKF